MKSNDEINLLQKLKISTEEVSRLKVLGFSSEEIFDEFTSLAAVITDCPISYISFLDGDRLWFKSKVGISSSSIKLSESLCYQTLLNNSYTELNQRTTVSSRMKIGRKKIGFYAALPLVTTKGIPIGTFCIADKDRKDGLSEVQKKTLYSLAIQVIRFLELRIEEEFLLTQSISKIGNWRQVSDSSKMFWSGELYKICEISADIAYDKLEQLLKERVHSEDQKIFSEKLYIMKTDQKKVDFEFRLSFDLGKRVKHIHFIGQPILDSSGNVNHFAGSLQDISERKGLEQENERLKVLNEKIQSIATIAGWEYDAVTRKTTWTKEAYSLYGISSQTPIQSIKGKSIFDDDNIYLFQSVQDCILNKQEFDNLFKLVDDKEESQWIRVIGKPVLKDNSTVTKVIGVFQNVTQDRQRSFESENFFKHSLDLLCITDKKGQLNKVNPSFTKTLGFGESELLHSSLVEFIHPQDLIDYQESLDQLHAGKKTVQFNCRFRTSSGTYRYLTWVAFSQLELDLIYYVAHDETDNHLKTQIQKTVSQIRSEYIKHNGSMSDLYEYVLSELLDISDSEYGLIAQVNVDEANETHLLSPLAVTSDYIFKRFSQILNDKVLKEYQISGGDPVFSKAFPQKGPYSGSSFVSIDSDFAGKNAPNLDHTLAVPIYQNGKLSALIALGNRKVGYEKGLTDLLMPVFDVVGEIVKAEAISNQLKRSKMSNEFYKMALDKSSIVAFTDREGKIIYVNDLFCEISQYSKEELIGESHNLVASGLHETNFYEEMWQTIASGEIWRGDICNRAKNGSQFWVDTVIVPYINDEGYIERYISIQNDITQIKVKQAELDNALKEANVATRAKSEFLSTMSHEIRTPLNGIVGMSSLLKETVLDEEQVEYLRSMEQSIATLLMLINDVLDFSKIEAGKMELEESYFNISEFIKTLTKPFYFAASEKNLFLDIKLNDQDVAIYGDSGRIGQILNNLLSNAVKFTENGSVSVNIDCTPKDNKCLLKISVKDTGVGIAKESQAKLFQAFSQADSSVSRKFGGTGLGLSITKKLVDLMGGVIYFDSQLSRGTTFHVEIMLSGWKNETHVESLENLKHHFPIELPGDVDTTSFYVLVAEDNPTNQILMKSMLQNIGFKFHIVSTGKEAVDSFKDLQFDLVLMDCQMPEMDGYEATRVIRSKNILNRSGKRIPIIALTANAIKGDEVACYQAGMDGYLPKPVTLKQLKNKMISFLIPQAIVNDEVSMSEKEPSLSGQNNNQSVKEVFSVTILDELISSLGKEAVEQILASYKTNSIFNLKKLQLAFLSEDFDQVIQVCHTMKSTARLLGGLGLYENLLAAEELAKTPSAKLNVIEKVYAFKILDGVEDLIARVTNVLYGKTNDDITADKNEMQTHTKVALVDDDETVHFLIKAYMAKQDVVLDQFMTADEMLTALDSGKEYDLLLLDNQLQHTTGVELLKTIRDKYKDLTPTIFLTGEDKESFQKKISQLENVKLIQKPIAKDKFLKEFQEFTSKYSKAS